MMDSLLPTSIRPDFQDQHGIGQYRTGAHWKDLPLIEKIRDIFISAIKILVVSTAVGAIAGAVASLALLPHLALIAGAVVGLAAALLGTALAASSIRELYRIGENNPALPYPDGTPKLGAWTSNNVHMTENGAESMEVKLKLVEKAEHSIEISGSYCGGKTFDRLLLLIEQKIKANPKLTVKLLSCEELLRSPNKALIARLGKAYPYQFFCLITQMEYHFFPTLRTEDNHTKMVIVDGAACITGGTGIHDILSREGTETDIDAGLNEDLFGRGSRDMDVVVEGSLAQTMRHQFYQLLEKWTIKTPESSRYGQPTTPCATPKREAESPTFFEQIGLTGTLADATMLASSYQHGSESEIKMAYLQMIQSARKTILVANMNLNYPEIVNALKEAALRGVRVTVITNGDNPTTPFLTRFLGVVNRSNMHQLTQIGAQCFEFAQESLLYHKKVMVVDGQLTTNGSFNISYDCVIGHDEDVVIIDSAGVAERTTTILERDIQMSQPFLKSKYEGVWGSICFAVNELKAAVSMQLTANIIQ